MRRYMIRTAYGIPGDACSDCLIGSFCQPCSANQLYQTTKQYGNPTPDGGRSRNVKVWDTNTGSNTCGNCILATFCLPCSIGASVEKATGMPCILGACCINICTARNIVRYQLRLKGDDVWEECCGPNIIMCCLGFFFWPLLFCACPVVIGIATQIKNNTDAMTYQSRRYLVDPTYTAPASSTVQLPAVVVMSAPQQQVMYPQYDPITGKPVAASAGYNQPAVLYAAPAPGYAVPAPAYGTQAPAYGAPAPAYSVPLPAYAQPPVYAHSMPYDPKAEGGAPAPPPAYYSQPAEPAPTYVEATVIPSAPPSDQPPSYQSGP
jgi:hypothetical protein